MTCGRTADCSSELLGSGRRLSLLCAVGYPRTARGSADRRPLPANSGQTTIFTDGLARLVAHEVDHLDGVLYIARMAPDSSTISVAEYKGTGQNWRFSPRSGA
ncbi:peptide deformylase [Actinacidiphila oryziradicis]|uniref:peptide deformylase n=1 Tax=Actinacidiphila oryziradicis TaxID=2571141 RepID=UPI002AFDEF67|nr:peptide deformylase [Actinacidiphila oryziradicis]